MTARTAARLLAASLTVPAVLLTGCTGSAEDVRREAFCDRATLLLDDVSAEVEAAPEDPGELAALVDDAVGRLEELEPPEEAADAWGDLVDSWRRLGDLLGRVDPGDPTGDAGLAAEVAEVQGDLSASGRAVDDYTRSSC